ncbi:hypothetical protein FGO68_gene13479 [Halteria grandinella]|uniref:Uncharacterized protein n=1 Tax=Halteria grandinella TaxID=5974 RepID=A0A8J8P015_HALGN|nr:hypothetical protein FGO68_gene13479 [Halteria grandinella]
MGFLAKQVMAKPKESMTFCQALKLPIYLIIQIGQKIFWNWQPLVKIQSKALGKSCSYQIKLLMMMQNSTNLLTIQEEKSLQRSMYCSKLKLKKTQANF